MKFGNLDLRVYCVGYEEWYLSHMDAENTVEWCVNKFAIPNTLENKQKFKEEKEKILNSYCKEIDIDTCEHRFYEDINDLIENKVENSASLKEYIEEFLKHERYVQPVCIAHEG